ncbi:nicotinate-nucleotide--dimethylbenzimidazole phosphoribosyltransferase, partial [Mesorhizobium sp. M7A.F.Ca.CA.001.13.1.1]|uniref:nicotinate-nucleotide--dimethylbenzimidazole phosphoribosyltransferase n=1 Tax=Mesorhizobium sp. M7A.F.Ca.CA.001.13.1.1 TaxID=2496728 RepID=UPI0019D2958C
LRACIAVSAPDPGPAQSAPPPPNSAANRVAATAAAAVLHGVNPAALDHCLLASLSPEPAHAHAAQRLGLRPLLDLGISHGEGAGAALAAGLVKAAALTSSGMAAAVRG